MHREFDDFNGVHVYLRSNRISLVQTPVRDKIYPDQKGIILHLNMIFEILSVIQIVAYN